LIWLKKGSSSLSVDEVITSAHKEIGPFLGGGVGLWPSLTFIGHYIRNTNRKHESETCAKMIISDLETRVRSASSRSGTCSMEG
jgi:hypothetical protein